MDAFSKILDFVGKYAWAVCVTIAFVLFVPEDIAKQIGITGIRVTFKGLLWIALVLTFVLALAAAFQYIDKRLVDGWFKERRESRQKAEDRALEAERKVEEDQQKLRQREEAKRQRFEILALRLKSLDQDEKMWIKYCLFHNTQTLSARRADNTAQSLCHKCILEEGSGQILNLPFHFPDDVWAFLLEHKNDFLPEYERNDRELSNISWRFLLPFSC